MYIARRFIDNHLQYFLCQSYHDGTCLTNRDFVNLGENPEQFIIYFGGSSFYIEMDKKELTKVFRQKAHEHHPDKGGDHERFIELSAAYKELLRSR